jgi:hypothetical protein
MSEDGAQDLKKIDTELYVNRLGVDPRQTADRAEFERQLEMAEKIMGEDRTILGSLSQRSPS